MNDFRLQVLKPHYEELFASCQIRSRWLPQIQSVAETIISRQSQYDAIATQTTVPWWFIGILHYREANFEDAHLYNGDPLTERTINVPQGRPVAPPANGIAYTFAESAVDALCGMKYDKAKDRSIAAWLWRFEMWKGFDYTSRGLNSEYLWNGTNHFGSGINRGVFLADGSFDPNATSDRVGTAAIVWYLFHKGILSADTQQQIGMSSQSSYYSATTLVSNNDTSQAVAVATATVQGQSPIQLSSVLQYYRELPHQNSAIAWLQQQLPPDLLAEFARRWRSSDSKTSAVITPVPVPAIQQPQVASPVAGNGKKMKVLKLTFFKVSTQQSHQLTDSEKVLVKAGTEFEIYSDEPAEGGHVKVVLANTSLGSEGRNTWYIFSEHVYIEGTEPNNRPVENPVANPVKISPVKTGPFQLPGYSSTFYLSDPILPNGHFSWAEATKNGTRIPEDQSIVDGILKIAAAMEEVRDYLGGRPITVNSWYRDPASNRAAGGATQSRHLCGDAVDFVVEGISPFEVHERLDSWWGSRGGIASASCFTHIDARGYAARWDYGF